MNLNIPPTRTTPSVIYNASTNTVEFAGQSFPEDSIPFYRNIEKQIEDHLKETGGPMTVVFKLDYFNTSSSKCLLDLLETLERVKNVSVTWYYAEGDEDILESGKDFAAEVKVPFKIILLPR